MITIKLIDILTESHTYTYTGDIEKLKKKQNSVEYYHNTW